MERGEDALRNPAIQGNDWNRGLKGGGRWLLLMVLSPFTKKHYVFILLELCIKASDASHKAFAALLCARDD